jgi:serine/threonine protein kinase/tetratricopeptide (TPR) repeat protein
MRIAYDNAKVLSLPRALPGRVSDCLHLVQAYVNPERTRIPITNGTRLGPYEILSFIGAGGMGEVYRARDPRLGRLVAIKVLSEEMSKSPEALARFEREAKAVAALSHPNILAIHDFGFEQGIHFAVMELLEGEDLRSRLRNGIPWRKAVEIGAAIADGLSAAHGKGIVHRDLKPENLFITSEGWVKILDFGLARVLPRVVQPDDVTESLPAETDEAKTRFGTVMGTYRYMSPEQVRGEPAGIRSDIFSLGCVLYEMAAGVQPFVRPTAAESIAATLMADPPQLTGSDKNIPPEFEALVKHCLEKKADDRFQSARDLAFALRSIGSSGTHTVIGPPPPVKARTRIRPVFGAGIVAAVLAALALYMWLGRSTGIHSLAVLPFVNAGGTANVEYLTDGITEGIINNLSQVPDLGVVSRSSVFRYKGKQADPQQVAQELKAGAVLTGRLVFHDDSVSVSAELMDTRTNLQIWGQQYDRKLADLSGVASEISREVSEKLRPTLSGEAKTRLSKLPTKNSEGYQLYLQGRYQWNKRTLDGIQQAIDLFQQAIVKDPGYALAHAGLADAYISLADYNVLSAREVMPRARKAATQALELDDSLAEAHASLGWVKLSHDWAFPDAEKEFKRAIDLNPNYAMAHEVYGEYLMLTGKPDEAAASMKHAQELEPVSLLVNNAVALNSYYAGHEDQAIDQTRKTLLLDPNFVSAHVLLGRIFQHQRTYGESAVEFQKALDLSEGDSSEMAAQAQGFAVSGNAAEARKILGELKERSQQTYVQPVWIAVILSALGQKDEAFQWMQKGYEDRSGWLIYLKVDPFFDNVRSDPRFTELVQRVGLP